MLALLVVQLPGMARVYFCDCTGVSVKVATDHCDGECHGNEVHCGSEDSHDHSDGEPKEHTAEDQLLVGVSQGSQSISIPVLPLLAILPQLIAAALPPPIELVRPDICLRGASSPPDTVRTVVLRI